MSRRPSLAHVIFSAICVVLGPVGLVLLLTGATSVPSGSGEAMLFTFLIVFGFVDSVDTLYRWRSSRHGR